MNLKVGKTYHVNHEAYFIVLEELTLPPGVLSWMKKTSIPKYIVLILKNDASSRHDSLEKGKIVFVYPRSFWEDNAELVKA